MSLMREREIRSDREWLSGAGGEESRSRGQAGSWG